MKNQVLFLIAASVGLLSAAPQRAGAQTTTTTAGITAIKVTSPVRQFLADRPGTVVLTVSVAYQGTLSRLGVRLAAPTGSTAKWTFVSATGPTAQPLPGDKTQWEFSYATTPASPVTFNVVLNYAADLADPNDIIVAQQTFTATALLGTVVATDSLGGNIQTTLSFTEAGFHTADTNRDTRLSLDELLRVIQIYNTRSANTRTGAYDANFAPLPNATPIKPTKPHSADIDGDGTISLMELNRVLDLCTYSNNGIRTGEYRADILGVDGFAPGP